jgi:hypothetical protein
VLKFLEAEQNRSMGVLANADLEVVAIEADFARHIDKAIFRHENTIYSLSPWGESWGEGGEVAKFLLAAMLWIW